MFKFWAAARAARALLAKVDFSVLWAILQRVIQAEQDFSLAGSGQQKLNVLLAWIRNQFPQSEAWVDLAETFIGAAVKLFNALGWFKK